MIGKKGGRLRNLATRAKDEEDPAWRNWYLEIDERRKALQKKPVVVCSYEKDGQDCKVVRQQSDPTPLKRFFKTARKKTGSRITEDLLWIRDAWTKSVGAEIAGETEVYAFKNGVLTISVFSNTLLQEIRQFHGAALLSDLREIWQASTPLLKINYRPGKKK